MACHFFLRATEFLSLVCDSPYHHSFRGVVITVSTKKVMKDDVSSSDTKNVCLSLDDTKKKRHKKMERKGEKQIYICMW